MQNEIRPAIVTQLPPVMPYEGFLDPVAATQQLLAIYERNTQFIRENFLTCMRDGFPEGKRFRANYPAIRIRVDTHQEVDSRLSYGHVVEPGFYAASVTQPDLFFDYFVDQIGLLIKNHGVPVEIGESNQPIPLHFCLASQEMNEPVYPESSGHVLRDHFDVPDLKHMDDTIVNGTWQPKENEPLPLAPFTAARVDYSLQRLQHYTATPPASFQKFVLFTNYQFYVDEFCAWAKSMLAEGKGGYTALIEPSSVRLPQMPSYHLMREGGSGITLINIGVGPSNAKTITDHVAVLRPSAWLMLGHCAGLRTTQRLGDYVLSWLCAPR